MNNKLEHIFGNDLCLTPEQLQAYAEGRLKGKALHEVERHLVSCELCSDALEGIKKLQDKHHLTEAITAIHKKLNHRIQRNPFLIDSFFDLQKAAAVIAILLIAAGGWYYINSLRTNEKLYSQYFEPYQQAKDSLLIQPQVSDGTKPESISKEIPVSSAQKISLNKKVTSTESKPAEEDLSALPAQPPTMDDVTSESQVTTGTGGAAAPATTLAKSEDNLDEEAVTDVKVVALESAEKKQRKTTTKTASESVREKASSAALHQVEDFPAKIKQEYDSSHYQKAFDEAEAFLKKNPGNPQALFYSGISALGLGKEKTAVKRLESCLQTGATEWKDETSWYLALAYIRLNKTNDAAALLQSLAKGNSSRKQEAASLLEKLKSR
jgi:hypothetical protein